MIAQLRRKLARILVAASRLVDAPEPLTPTERAVLRAVDGDYGVCVGYGRVEWCLACEETLQRGLATRGESGWKLTDAGRAALEAT